MIARKNRFHGYGSLRFVYKNGKVVRGQLCKIKYCLNPKRSEYRAAVVVSKKVHKSAVVRNRIRRRIYEIIQATDISQPYDLVCVVFDERIAGMPFDELQKTVGNYVAEAVRLR